MAVFQIVIFLVIATILPVWAQGGGPAPEPGSREVFLSAYPERFQEKACLPGQSTLLLFMKNQGAGPRGIPMIPSYNAAE